MAEIDWKQEYHRQQRDLSHERQLANIALDENEALTAELEQLRAQVASKKALASLAHDLVVKHQAEIVELRAENAEVLAWARLAYLAVKFAETINPRGLQSLVSSAPDSVKDHNVT